MTMSLDSPRYVGGLLPPHADTITDSQGNAVNLTGATITLRLVNQMNPTQIINCAGTPVIDNATLGQYHYPWQSADLATPGVWDLSVTASYGGVPREFDPSTIVILSHP